MNNHAHLLAKEGSEPLSTTIQRLGVRYAQWFNRKYDRIGHLFQDRFRSEPVETDEYFLSALVYIFQNPVKAGLCNMPAEYEWSSRRFLEKDTGMIDLPELAEMAPIKVIKQKEKESLDEKSLEPMAARRGRYSDKDVALMLFGLGNVNNASEFQQIPLEGQQVLVAKLRSGKVPIRQIARMTGVSKGILEKWGKR